MKKTLGACAIALLLSTSAASAVECRASPERGSYWFWRLIDGKRCWVKGRPAKHTLYWPKAKAETKPEPAEVWPEPLPLRAKDESRVLTPQQRIDEAFKCLYIHNRGGLCE